MGTLRSQSVRALAELRAGIAAGVADRLAGQDGPDATLQRFYTFGRAALEGGVGLLDVVDAFTQLFTSAELEGLGTELLMRREEAGRLLAQILAPFEMAQRGYREAIVALEQRDGELSAEIAFRRRAEEQLQERTWELQSILDSLGEGVLVADSAGRIREANPAAREILGLNGDDHGLAPLTSGPGAQMAGVLRGERVDRQEVFLQLAGRPEGTWLLVTGRSMRDEDGESWGAVLAFTDITDNKLDEAELRRSLHQVQSAEHVRRRLLGRLLEAQEEERRRIAADIHDESIQVMAAAYMRLQMLRRKLTTEAEREACEELEGTVKRCVQSLRRLLFELRPISLDRDGLAAALSDYLEQTERDTGQRFRLHDKLSADPTTQNRLILYRIAQEALINVRKHARAEWVTVTLGEQADGVLVTIADDGRGFATEKDAVPGHLGLQSMRERAETAGGWCRIASTPGQGTTVQIWLPADEGLPPKDGAWEPSAS